MKHLPFKILFGEFFDSEEPFEKSPKREKNPKNFLTIWLFIETLFF